MVTIKSERDIQHLRDAGRLLAGILRRVTERVKPGIQTIELDAYAETLIRQEGAEPSFKHYRQSQHDPPYPTTICASVNNEVVHAPASKRILKEGDIVGIDIGLKMPLPHRAYFVDMAVTVPVGKVSSEAEKLLRVTREALNFGIQQVKPGGFLQDISRVIQEHIESQGFSVVRGMVGHGVGFAVHEDPQVPNFVSPHFPNIELKKGMVLAIEPMVNAGSYEIRTLDDGWTVVTADGSLSAHFEHTVAVKEDGYEILTKREE